MQLLKINFNLLKIASTKFLTSIKKFKKGVAKDQGLLAVFQVECKMIILKHKNQLSHLQLRRIRYLVLKL